MNYYTMKTLTTNGDWFQFSMSDLPVLIDEKCFVLLGRQNTPKLRLDSIRRGDVVTGLYEGDVFSMDGCKWVVCYERGFYAINEEYVIRYLNSLKDFTILGDESDVKIDVAVSYRANHLFKVKDSIFRLQDIVGALDGKLLLRPVKQPVDPDLIQQECCATYKGKRVYLGDELDGAKLVLYNGRLARMTDEGPIDITTGRVL